MSGLTAHSHFSRALLKTNSNGLLSRVGRRPIAGRGHALDVAPRYTTYANNRTLPALPYAEGEYFDVNFLTGSLYKSLKTHDQTSTTLPLSVTVQAGIN